MTSGGQCAIFVVPEPLDNPGPVPAALMYLYLGERDPDVHVAVKLVVRMTVKEVLKYIRPRTVGEIYSRSKPVDYIVLFLQLITLCYNFQKGKIEQQHTVYIVLSSDFNIVVELL